MDEAAETDAEGKELRLSAEELSDAEDELIRIMHERFINGLDIDFNYSLVDNNPEYDDQKQIELDS